MPLPPLLLIFIGLPILELVLLFEVHGIVGFLPTVLLVFTTGIVGATLVRQQGVQTVVNIRQELALGNLPAPQMIDGIMILISGAFLITPGLLTDTLGFALLILPVRKLIRKAILKRIGKGFQHGYVEVKHVEEDTF
ncbi:MAG TPA: membrane protein FxsA [Verrucomicrobia bacterium]|nr:membrane protein FxsA [Kiritimatiellaceae bacterium]HBO88071.1 membrane protein FxsA [Verrucomicrobiota bacterium]|tara:strand:+ start:1095 stop:1505 length:411 start_codon:yes stop_codon:yes gene_type:complete